MHEMTPAFLGLVRGELFKIRQMTSIKIYLILTLGLMVAVNITPGPQITVDGTHTLLIALGYAVIFAAIAIILTWKRDVKE